jgi:hypothetical protein
MSDTNNTNNESIDTLINDNDDEGFVNMDLEKKESNMMSDIMKPCTKHLNNEPLMSTTSKLIHNKPCRFSYSTRNPYDDGL